MGMKLSEIRAYPTNTAQLHAHNPSTRGQNLDESCFRCYHILEQVKEWLEDSVPADTILELVADLED